jgi:hypothetical protein
MKDKLRKILRLIYEGLGEWAAVNSAYCPEWTLPFKEAAEKTEEAFADFDQMREDVRKEIEGRFISGSIKRSGRIGSNGSPLEVGRRKLRGVEYKVFVTVIPIDENETHNEEANNA